MKKYKHVEMLYHDCKIGAAINSISLEFLELFFMMQWADLGFLGTY